jgi:hypothetical protein
MFVYVITFLLPLSILFKFISRFYLVIKIPCPLDAFIGRDDTPGPVPDTRRVRVLQVVSEHRMSLGLVYMIDDDLF